MPQLYRKPAELSGHQLAGAPHSPTSSGLMVTLYGIHCGRPAVCFDRVRVGRRAPGFGGLEMEPEVLHRRRNFHRAPEFRTGVVVGVVGNAQRAVFSTPAAAWACGPKQATTVLPAWSQAGRPRRFYPRGPPSTFRGRNPGRFASSQGCGGGCPIPA